MKKITFIQRTEMIKFPGEDSTDDTGGGGMTGGGDGNNGGDGKK